MKQFAVVFLLFLASCGGEEDEPQPSKTELITGSTWNVVSVGNQPPIEAFVHYTFNTNGTLVRETNHNVVNGTWSLTNTEGSINVSFNSGGNYTFKIVKLTKTEFVYSDTQSQETKLIPL